MQAQALKSIFGYGVPYAIMRERAGISTHRERRIELVDKFARKALDNPRFAGWFPVRRAGRVGRRGEEFHEFTARTDRLNNTPLFYM